MLAETLVSGRSTSKAGLGGSFDLRSFQLGGLSDKWVPVSDAVESSPTGVDGRIIKGTSPAATLLQIYLRPGDSRGSRYNPT